MKLEHKIAWVAETYKKYKADGYMVLQDHEGWTDSYMADLMTENPVIRNEVEAKFLKGKVYRFVVDKEKAPKIKSLIPDVNDTRYSKVDDFDTTLVDSRPSLVLKLKAGDKKAFINPYMLGYFLNTHKTMASIMSLKIAGSLNPVMVMVDDAVIGLIMPLRIEV